MTRRTYRWLAATTMLTLYTPAASGQSRVGPWGFVNAQYSTRSSAYLYTGYGWRALFAMAGAVHNPRTGYSEFVGGAGVVFKTGANAEHWVAFATAGSGSRSFGQVYWLPKVSTGAVTSRATVKWKIPYDGSDPQKLSISPLSMTTPLGRRLAGGVAMELAAAQGTRTNFGAGPELRLRLSGATFGLNVLRDLRTNASSVRLSVASML